MLLLCSTCDDLITRFLPKVDVKIKICHHITHTTILPAAASKTEKSTDNHIMGPVIQFRNCEGSVQSSKEQKRQNIEQQLIYFGTGTLQQQ